MRAVFVENGADIEQILPARDERTGDEVHAVLDAEDNVLAILLAQIRLAEHLAGEVHALFIAQQAAYEHGAMRFRIGHLVDAKAEHAVAQKDHVAGLKILHQVFIADRNAMLVADDFFGGEGEFLSLHERYLPLFKGADAVLGPLRVEHDGDGQIQLLAQLFDAFNARQLLRVRAVRKIEPRHVHAGQAHLPQGFFAFRRGTDRADDLRLAHKTKLLLLFFSLYYNSNKKRGRV